MYVEETYANLKKKKLRKEDIMKRSIRQDDSEFINPDFTEGGIPYKLKFHNAKFLDRRAVNEIGHFTDQTFTKEDTQ